MGTATAFEQFLMEQINHARLAPQENFERYVSSYSPLASDHSGIQNAITFFNVSGPVLARQVASLEPVEPLAWSSVLNVAATGHSQRMIETGEQAHTLKGSTPGSRATAAGYDWQYLSENIYAYAKDAMYGHAGFMIDWGYTSTGIQDGAGHRVNIMSDRVREVGIGVVEDVAGSSGVGPNVITQNFGLSSGMAETILLGVVRSETDGNGYYSIGEGMGNVQVRLGDGTSDKTPGAGGYRLDTSSGTQKVTFSGGGLDTSVTTTISLGKGNAKLDLVDGTLFETTANLVLGSGGQDARFIGDIGSVLEGNSVGNTLEGNGLSNTLVGNAGRDRLLGGIGADSLFGGQGADTLLGQKGSDLLKGGGGNDLLRGQNGTDRLDGGMGNDTLFGGYGRDVFLFRAKDFGKDKIKDFSDVDVMRITAAGEVQSRSALKAALQDTAYGVLYDHLDDGLNTIRIVGTKLSTLDLDQFVIA